MQLDNFRPPITFGIGPYSLKTLFEFNSYYTQLNYLKNELNEIQKELNPFFEEAFYSYPFTSTELSSIQFLNRQQINTSTKREETNLIQIKRSDIGYIFTTSFTILICTIFILILGFIIFDNFILTILLTIISLSTLYLFFAGLFTRSRRLAGEKYDKNIKKSVQEVIAYGNEFIKENNLNPKDYPIKLRHNDYNGLECEIKGKNSYICYFKP